MLKSRRIWALRPTGSNSPSAFWISQTFRSQEISESSLFYKLKNKKKKKKKFSTETLSKNMPHQASWFTTVLIGYLVQKLGAPKNCNNRCCAILARCFCGIFGLISFVFGSIEEEEAHWDCQYWKQVGGSRYKGAPSVIFRMTFKKRGFWDRCLRSTLIFSSFLPKTWLTIGDLIPGGCLLGQRMFQGLFASFFYFILQADFHREICCHRHLKVSLAAWKPLQIANGNRFRPHFPPPTFNLPPISSE